MRLLITGSGGFLGKNVVPKFAKEQSVTLLTPRSRELDLLDQSSTMVYFERERPDVVLHMAAVCGGIKANMKAPADFIHLNSEMTINIFNAIKKFDVKSLYTLGSVCSYPCHTPVPFKEKNIWNGYPEATNAPYGIAKRLQMEMQKQYADQYGLKGAHLIPVNLFGPQDLFDLENSHVIPALINKFVTAVKNNKQSVELWGSGQATREFLYVEDCAHALHKAVMLELDYPEPINLGTGESIKIIDLANIIADIVKYRGNIVTTGDVNDGQPLRQLDVSRAYETFGFRARTSLREGLEKTIKWYEENYE